MSTSEDRRLVGNLGVFLQGEQGLDLSWPRREAIPSLGYHDSGFLGLKVDPC